MTETASNVSNLQTFLPYIISVLCALIAETADMGIIMDDAFNRCEKCSEEHFAWEEYGESLTSEL